MQPFVYYKIMRAVASWGYVVAAPRACLDGVCPDDDYPAQQTRVVDWVLAHREAAPFDGTVRPLEQQMAGDANIWRTIAAREGLAESDLGRLASPWHSDADLGRPIEVVTDMSKSRRLGFTGYKPTDDAFFELFAQLRADRLIP